MLNQQVLIRTVCVCGACVCASYEVIFKTSLSYTLASGSGIVLCFSVMMSPLVLLLVHLFAAMSQASMLESDDAGNLVASVSQGSKVSYPERLGGRALRISRMRKPSPVWFTIGKG